MDTGISNGNDVIAEPLLPDEGTYISDSSGSGPRKPTNTDDETENTETSGGNSWHLPVILALVGVIVLMIACFCFWKCRLDQMAQIEEMNVLKRQIEELTIQSRSQSENTKNKSEENSQISAESIAKAGSFMPRPTYSRSSDGT
eukprot:UN16220